MPYSGARVGPLEAQGKQGPPDRLVDLNIPGESCRESNPGDFEEIARFGGKETLCNAKHRQCGKEI